MKLFSLFAAAALAVTPAIAMAEGATTQSSDQLENALTAGGTAEGPVKALESDDLPAGAMVVGGVVILAGVVIGIVAATDDDDNNAVSTTSTN